MSLIWEELTGGFSGTQEMVSLTVRLVLASLVGAVIGFQRERMGKAAGLRTHMLVSSGAAVFVIGGAELGMGSDSLARVIQGLITGIGFLGAGAILKIYERREVEGLTTAAGIWMTAALGVSVGLGRFGLALVATVLSLATLSLVRRVERALNLKEPDGDN